MEHSAHGSRTPNGNGEHQRKPDRDVRYSVVKKLKFRGQSSAQSEADLARGDQMPAAPKNGDAKDNLLNPADTAGPRASECTYPLKHSGLSLFRGVTFRYVDDGKKEEAASSSRLGLPPEGTDVCDSRPKRVNTRKTVRAGNTGTELSFRLQEFAVRGTTVPEVEINHTNTLYNSSRTARATISLKRQPLPPEDEEADSKQGGNGATTGGRSSGRFYPSLLDVDAAKELPPYDALGIQTAKRSESRLHRVYRKICKHPAYKFFPDEDVRYFDIMVTGIPVYFSSKKLERSFVLYSCPALSGYIIGFHSLFIFCTVLQFLLCFVAQPAFYLMWKVQLPFFFSWAISLGSIVVTLVWRVTGGRNAERFNTRENKLMKNIELPAGVIIQEAVHWRPCFTEDFAAVSFSLALGIPIIVSGSLSAYLYCTTKDNSSRPSSDNQLPPIFSSPSGLYGFAASQALLALSVLFLSSAVLASGIRVRKLLFVCTALLLSTVYFHICCSLLFFERTLLFPGLLFTYSMIPISIISRMRTERLRRFLFLLHERAQYAQKESFDDSTCGIPSSTPMEELIVLINEAGLKVRQTRSKYNCRKSPELLESEAMLVRCLMILTGGGDLFAFRLHEGEEEGEKEVRDDLLNIIGSSVGGLHRTSRRGACPRLPAMRDVTWAPEDEDEQSQDRIADRAGEGLTSFHADPVLNLWAILDMSSAPAGPGGTWVPDVPADNMSRKTDRTGQSLLLALLPVFPSARVHVACSRRLSIEWDLDMIEVEKKCKGFCLYRVGCDLLFFKVHGFDCSKEIIKNFILDAAEVVGVIIAALCHDIGHQGKNNAYYVASGAPVSLIYNDTAVLENFHACTTFKILARPDCNILSNLQEEAFRLLRARIIELILATDMKMHFENISKFRLRRNAPDFAPILEDDRWMALRMCIKGGDLSHATLSWESHVSWSYRAAAEFYEQGDLELSQGRTIANMFDRRKHGDFPKSQEAFLKYIVVPLYEELAAVDASGAVQSECLKRVSENRERWCHLQNNPVEFSALDEEHQQIVSTLKEALEVSAKINIACTQAILRAAHRSAGEGNSKCGTVAMLGTHSPSQSAYSGSSTAGEVPESLPAKTDTGSNPPFSNTDDKASNTTGKGKKGEVQRVVGVVTAVKETVQHVAKQAAESAAKAAKQMGTTAGRTTGSVERGVGEAVSADLQH